MDVSRFVNLFERDLRLKNYSKPQRFKELFGPLLTASDDPSQRETDFPMSKQSADTAISLKDP